MVAVAIHVVPDESFDDWVVRGDVGHEFGHYPTGEDAEQGARASARSRTRRSPPGRTNKPQEL